MTLRDIRTDLRERIQLADERYAQMAASFEKELKAIQERYRAEVAALKEAQDMLAKLLEAEERRLGAAPQSAPRAAPVVELADFFVQQIQVKSPRSKDELKDLAVKAGYFPDISTAGRATHTTLLNIARVGRIRDLGDGNYGMPQIFEIDEDRGLVPVNG